MDGELKISIRPGRLRIHPDAVGSARVFTIEPLGRGTILHLELPDGQHVKSVISGRPVVKEGERVNISISIISSSGRVQQFVNPS